MGRTSWNQGGKQSSSIHLPHKTKWQRILQWSDPCSLQNHQTHHGICFQNRTCDPFLWLQRSHTILDSTWRNGSCTTRANSSHDRQLNHHQTYNAKNDTKRIKINGHVLPMAKSSDICGQRDQATKPTTRASTTHPLTTSACIHAMSGIISHSYNK